MDNVLVHNIPIRSGFQSSIKEFLSQSSNEILAELTKSQEGSLETTQRDAWQKQIDLLKDLLSNLSEGHILFEFIIPRIGKRVDNILIIKNIIFVIEFKIGAEKYYNQDKVQTIDYALDLKNFHQGSHFANIVPILVATDAANFENIFDYSADKVAINCLLANCKNFKFIFTTVLEKTNQEKNINFSKWIKSSYLPTPTIIEASKVLYKGHNVNDISRNEAGVDNLGKTTTTLNNAIDESKRNGYKSIFLLTGVPGAGKTLAGLNLANSRRKSDETNEEHTVFLSGNGPLVRVLSESLARDAKDNYGKKISDARRETTSFIQNIHHFRDECIKNENPPLERIVIFDEAQRAWHLEKTKSFMQTKKGIPDFNSSEPDFLIGAMNRHKGWAVIVCLIGGGQEINDGEGGMEEWLRALKDHYPEWRVWTSYQLDSKYYLPTFDLNHLKGRLIKIEHLHLGVSIRSFRSEKVSKAITSLLEDEKEEALKSFREISDFYPIKITRSIEKAKEWLRAKARGSERFGILVSSGAKRLKPLGLFAGIVSEKGTPNWFLNNHEDIRSSFALEDPATEFQVQGLELDWAGIVWDGDLIKTKNNWLYKSFVGCRWTNINKSIDQKYKLNSYRVLLTRARQGMVIVIPKGDEKDPTRQSKIYDPTWKYLKEIGLDVI